MKKLTVLILMGMVCGAVWGQDVQYRKRYTSIPNNSSIDDLAEPTRSGTVAYELDGYPSGGGLSSENFQVLDIGISQRRFQLARKWTLNELYFRSTNTSGVLGSFSRIWHSGNSNKLTVDWSCKNLSANGNIKAKRVTLLDWYNPSLGFTSSCIVLNGARQDGEWKLYGDGARSSIGIINMDIFSNIRFISHHDHTFNSGKSMSDEDLIRNNTKMIIEASGKVGIGTTSPSAKLDVAGNIKAHEIEVTLAAMQDLQLNGTLAANNITYTANGNTADFVFEDNYQLKALSEVEAFIITNKHLPEIPSAAEMEEAGVNLAEMNKLLLMKVEELTLYSIEQEKARKKLESELEKEREERQAMRDEIDELKRVEDRLAKLEALFLK